MEGCTQCRQCRRCRGVGVSGHEPPPGASGSKREHAWSKREHAGSKREQAGACRAQAAGSKREQAGPRFSVGTRTLYPCDGGRIRLDPAQRNAVFGYTDGQIVFLTQQQVADLASLDSSATLTPSMAAPDALDHPASGIAQLILGS